MDNIEFVLEDLEELSFGLDVGVKELYPELENLEVQATTERQVFTHENSYGYDEVVVLPKGESDPNDFFWMDKIISGSSSQTYPTGWLKTVKKVPAFKNSGTSCQRMFYFCGAKEIDASLIDTTAVTNMDDMFNYCENVEELDVSHFNTSNVTSMRQIFRNCSNLKAVDLTNWDTQKVKDMAAMFYGCRSLTEIDMSNFDFTVLGTSTNTTGGLYELFATCTNLRKITFPKSKHKVGVTLNTMFSSNTSLESIDVSNFDTSGVISLYYTFYNCENLTSLDLSEWDMSSVSQFYRTFGDCERLKTIKFSGIPCDLSAKSSGRMDEMFENCYKLESIDLSWLYTSTSLNVKEAFKDCRSLKFLDIRNMSLDAIATYNASGIFNGIPTDCEIIVKDDASKAWAKARNSTLTNIKTVAEYEAA